MLVVLAGCAAEAPEGSFVQSETGVVVTPAQGESRRVRLKVRTDRIIRVTSVNDKNLDVPKSLMVLDSNASPPSFKVEKREGDLVLETAQVIARVSLTNGNVQFTDRSGKPMLAEVSTPAPAQGISQRFNSGNGRSVLRLGQHQNAQMNSTARTSNSRSTTWTSQCRSCCRAATMACCGTATRSRASAIRAPMAGFARSQDPRRGGQEGRVHCELLHQRRTEGQARREPTSTISSSRISPQVAEGGARRQGVADHRLAQHRCPDQTVIWEGRMESATSRRCTSSSSTRSSYYKLYADDKLMLDGWRQNWNAWYHNFELPMTAGKPVASRRMDAERRPHRAVAQRSVAGGRTAFAVVGVRAAARSTTTSSPARTQMR